jgi:non-homologous end joining protein Ku
VLDLVETKRAGQGITAHADKPKLAPVIDLMEALKKSLAAAAPAEVAPKKAAASETKPGRRRKTG